MVRSRTNAPLKSLTKLEQEVESKRRTEEEKERLDILGQESEAKALPWIQKEVYKKEKKEKEYLNLSLDLLKNAAKKKKVNYFRILTSILLHFLKEEDIPKKYHINIDLTDVGIITKIAGTKFYGGFKVCFLPSYDLRACRVMAMKVGNTVAKLEGAVHSSKGGIILPDSLDKKNYGRITA